MTEADEHEQRLLALEREIIAMREDMEAAIARAEAAERRVRELELLLSDALPLTEQAEFLLDKHAWGYGCNPASPSPAEWGVAVEYRQTRDAMPYDQYRADVEKYHREDLEEDDGSGEFLTISNKIRRALSTAKDTP